MADGARQPGQTDAAAPELAISLEKVCFLIMKAREFDAKDEVSETDVASNPSDDKQMAVLEDHADDPSLEEIVSFIDALNEDEQIDLVTLTWLGRGDYSAGDWNEVRAEAARARSAGTARYLCGTPLLPNFLEAGLNLLGHSCEDYEIDRL